MSGIVQQRDPHQGRAAARWRPVRFSGRRGLFASGCCSGSALGWQVHHGGVATAMAAVRPGATSLDAAPVARDWRALRASAGAFDPDLPHQASHFLLERGVALGAPQ
jgi:hypothetical protein